MSEIISKKKCNKSEELRKNLVFDEGVLEKLPGRIYAVGRKRTCIRITLKLANYVLGVPDNLIVDHINGNPLDNRKVNLRVVTAQQNSFNTAARKFSSNYKGVSKRNRRKPWEVNITHDGKDYYLGTFSNEDDAAKAYDKKAKELFGEFARLNFP